MRATLFLILRELKSLPEEFSSVAEKFTSKWKERKSTQGRILTTFPDEQRAKEGLAYQKGGSRQCAYTEQEAAQAKEDDAHDKEQKRVFEKAQMDNHLLLINATKDISEVGGIEDMEEEEKVFRLDNKQFAFSDHKSGIISNHQSPRSSAIITFLIPRKSFPEVEKTLC